VGKGGSADEGRLGVGAQIRQFVEVVRKLAQLRQVRPAKCGAAHLQEEIRQDGREAGVAGALAVAVDRALDQRGARGDARRARPPRRAPLSLWQCTPTFLTTENSRTTRPTISLRSSTSVPPLVFA